MPFRLIERMNLERNAFFTLAVDGGEWSVSRRYEFIQGKASRYALNEGWMNSRDSLEVVLER